MDTEVEDTYREPIPMESSVHFSFTDFPMKHEELTKLLGIQPTKFWNKGDMSQSLKPRVLEFSRWTLESDIDPQLDPEEHLSNIYNIILPKKEIIKKVSQDIGPPFLEIVLYVDPDFYEAVYIEPNILKELGDMEIQLQVHIYHHIIE
jgi:hypothetical protein